MHGNGTLYELARITLTPALPHFMTRLWRVLWPFMTLVQVMKSYCWSQAPSGGLQGLTVSCWSWVSIHEHLRCLKLKHCPKACNLGIHQDNLHLTFSHLSKIWVITCCLFWTINQYKRRYKPNMIQKWKIKDGLIFCHARNASIQTKS